jgi:hypothetical protein
VQEYGEGQRAHRTAFAALKHSLEKVGDHWEPEGHKGPSDSQAARSTPSSRTSRSTAGGVDANASKSHLMDVAKWLDISDRSRMTKDELLTALKEANNRKTARPPAGSGSVRCAAAVAEPTPSAAPSRGAAPAARAYSSTKVTSMFTW